MLIGLPKTSARNGTSEVEVIIHPFETFVKYNGRLPLRYTLRTLLTCNSQTARLESFQRSSGEMQSSAV